jgi:hypothetical protein
MLTILLPSWITSQKELFAVLAKQAHHLHAVIAANLMLLTHSVVPTSRKLVLISRLKRIP